MLFSTPMTATAFFGFNMSKDFLTKSGEKFTIPKMIGCGMFGGVFASQISCPTERLKCIMQENAKVKSPYAALRYILKTEGFRGIHKGMIFTLFRDMNAYGKGDACFLFQ